MKKVCVFCGSNTGKNPVHLLAAQSLGKIFAKENLTLVYGGGNVGIMGELANSVLQYSGEVIGVIPEDLVAREVAMFDITQLKIVKSMHERKALMSDMSDGFIAMSGGIGTLEEFFEVWTWAQLGIHSKPIGILNIENYFDKLIEFIHHGVDENFVKKENLDMIIIDDEPERLIERMRNYTPIVVRKWIDKDEI